MGETRDNLSRFFFCQASPPVKKGFGTGLACIQVMKKRFNICDQNESPSSVLRGGGRWFLMILLVAGTWAHADTLNLRNGNKMEGVVTDERPDAVQFEEYGIQLWIKKSKIESIQRSSAKDRAQQLERLTADRAKEGVQYPAEVNAVLTSLGNLDKKKARRKQLAASIRQEFKANEALEKKMTQLRKELNAVSTELEALRPPETRNQFGGRPLGYWEKVRAYNTRFSDYQKLHSDLTDHSTAHGVAEKKLAENSRELAEVSGQYAELRKQSGREWKKILDDHPPEALERGEWFLAIGRRLQEHTDFGPVDPSKKVVVRKSDEGLQVTLQADRRGQFLLPVVLNGKTAVNVVVDTGATVTIVSKEVADKAGLTMVGEAFEATLADGKKVKVRPAVAESMRIFGVVYPDEKIGVMEGRVGEEVDGLLGMTFLKKVPFTIRNRTLVMTL
jgi:clan AA aspartic protease (TIGR02281 family)